MNVPPRGVRGALEKLRMVLRDHRIAVLVLLRVDRAVGSLDRNRRAASSCRIPTVTRLMPCSPARFASATTSLERLERFAVAHDDERAVRAAVA